MTSDGPVMRNGIVLPERYGRRWREEIVRERIAPRLVPNVRILDVGPGPRPMLPPAQRPSGCTYVALDAAADELAAAASSAYDEVVVDDVARRVPKLEGRFDLVVSWQVLEHVKPLDRALENLRAYLRPTGQFIAFLSGAFAVPSVVNRLIPRSFGVTAMERLLGRDPRTVFRAHYDRCWYGALGSMLQSWSRAEVVPFYLGALYFGFSRALLRAYLAYEEWVRTRGHRNLATHYLVHAAR
jgi:SAM-dependent methyltransferase